MSAGQRQFQLTGNIPFFFKLFYLVNIIIMLSYNVLSATFMERPWFILYLMNVLVMLRENNILRASLRFTECSRKNSEKKQRKWFCFSVPLSF